MQKYLVPLLEWQEQQSFNKNNTNAHLLDESRLPDEVGLDFCKNVHTTRNGVLSKCKIKGSTNKILHTRFYKQRQTATNMPSNTNNLSSLTLFKGCSHYTFVLCCISPKCTKKAHEARQRVWRSTHQWSGILFGLFWQAGHKASRWGRVAKSGPWTWLHMNTEKFTENNI